MVELKFKINFSEPFPKSFFIECNGLEEVVHTSKNISENLQAIDGTPLILSYFFGNTAPVVVGALPKDK